MNIENYIHIAKEESLKNRGTKFYIIWNSYGDWVYIDKIPVENENNGFQVLCTILNGEEI